jgi:hypothetical protein
MTIFSGRRSPIAIAESGCGSAKEFLAHLYEPGERVLVFTQQWSQGDFFAQIDETEDGREIRRCRPRLSAERGYEGATIGTAHGWERRGLVPHESGDGPVGHHPNSETTADVVAAVP